MIQVVGPFTSGVAAGADGSATANQDTPIRVKGLVVAVDVVYNDTPPNTTDVTIKTKGTAPAEPSFNVLVLSNQATNVRKYPLVQNCDVNGADIAGQYAEPMIDDYLNIAIAQANAGDSVSVWLLVVS